MMDRTRGAWLAALSVVALSTSRVADGQHVPIILPVDQMPVELRVTGPVGGDRLKYRLTTPLAQPVTVHTRLYVFQESGRLRGVLGNCSASFEKASEAAFDLRAIAPVPTDRFVLVVTDTVPSPPSASRSAPVWHVASTEASAAQAAKQAARGDKAGRLVASRQQGVGACACQCFCVQTDLVPQWCTESRPDTFSCIPDTGFVAVCRR